MQQSMDGSVGGRRPSVVAVGWLWLVVVVVLLLSIISNLTRP